MAVDYYLKSSEWPGESKQKDHTGEIEVLSFSWGGAQPIDPHGTGHSTGKVQIDPLIILKHVDKASAKFLASLSKGTHVSDATLICLKSTGKGSTEPYFTIKLSDVFVGKYQLVHEEGKTGADGKSEAVTTHTERVTLYYNKVEVNYKSQDAKGGLTTAGTWSLDVAQGVTA